MQLKEINSREEWDKLVTSNTGHPLQLWGWGETKAAEGNWTAHRLWAEEYGGAQILIRKLPRPFNKMAYIPRGPIFSQKKLSKAAYQKFLSKLVEWAKQQRCIELKVESAEAYSRKIELEKSYSISLEQNRGWKRSKNRILLAKTVILDLAKSEDELLSDMTKKTRQYINKSSRENVTVRLVKTKEDLEKCLQIYKTTAKRAGFALHSDDYYLNLAKFLGKSNQVYVAEYGKEVLSFLWNITTPETSFELYGGVTDEGQKLRANYILKWHVIKESKKDGVKYYDMNGLLNDGVSNFKLGFSDGQETYLVPTVDKPLSPLYSVWENLIPAGKKFVRMIKR